MQAPILSVALAALSNTVCSQAHPPTPLAITRSDRPREESSAL